MAGVGRNDPCPCGSGQRYKACHGKDGAPIVDFVVAGTQKGGTTALFTYLKEHPQLRVPRVLKEVHFFDRDENFVPVPAYARYHAHFDAARPAVRATGEATPFYMYAKAVPARVRAYNPAMKWIVLLRDPAARAYSHWNWEVSRGREPLSFEEALAAEPGRLAASPDGQHRRHAYVDRGRYRAQLARIRALFPPDRLLVLKSESLQHDPAAVLDAVARFLGIDAFPATDPRTINALGYRESMPPGARDFLAKVFAEEIDGLEAELGWDLGDWRRG